MGSGARPRRIWLTGLILALALLPLWLIPCFSSQDGPYHTYNAFVAASLVGDRTSPYHGTYQVSWFPTNCLGTLLGAGLSEFVAPLYVRNCVLAIYILLLVSAVGYAARTFHGSALTAQIVALPLLYSRLVYMGFDDFNLSLPLMLYVECYWIRHFRNMRWNRLAILTLFVGLLCLAHPFTLVLTMASILVLYGGSVVQAMYRRLPDAESVWGSLSSRSSVLIVLAPIVVLITYARSHYNQPFPDDGDTPFRCVLFFHSLITATNTPLHLALLAICLGLMAVSVSFSLVALSTRARPLMGLLALVILLLFTIPDGMLEGAAIWWRLSLISYLLLVVLFSCINTPRGLRAAVCCAAMCAAVVPFVQHYATLRKLSERGEEYVSGSTRIHDGTVLLAYNADPYGEFAWTGQSKSTYMGGAGLDAYLCARAHCIPSVNYEPLIGYFPVRFSEGSAVKQVTTALPLALDDAVAGLPITLRTLEAAGVNRRLVNIALCGISTGSETDSFHRVENVLARSGFKLIFTSRPSGALRLYAASSEQQD